MCKEGIINDAKASTFCGTPGKEYYYLVFFKSINFL
jgi:hypothetical protein